MAVTQYISEWHENIIRVGPNFPATPFKFQRWWLSDSVANTLTLYYHNGTSWVQVGNTIKATDTVYGITRLSAAPAVAGTPIAVGDNDSRMTNSRTPTGSAGGDLTGTYPNPTLAIIGAGATVNYPAQIIYDSKGRVTGATGGTSPSATAVGGDVSGTVGAIVLPAKGTAGSYAYPASITTDAKGAVTAVTAGSSPSSTTMAGDVTGTVGANTLPAVGTAGTYAYPVSLTTDAKGRVSAVTAGTAPSATAVGGDVSGTVANIVLPTKGTPGTYAYPSQIITDSKGAVTSVTAGTAATSPEYFTGLNATGTTIAALKAVATDGNNTLIKLADSGAVNDYPVIGFTTGSIASSATGQVQTGGILGGFTSPSLTAGALYFSDPSSPGGITTTVPSTTGQKQQIVGRALSTSVLLIEISEPITIGSSSANSAIQRSSTTGRLSEFGVVALQSATPGSAQTGNANLTGTILAATMTASGTVQGATINGTTTVQVNSVNINPVPKNWIINGNFDICQRYGPLGSFATPLSTTPYILDRWFATRDGSSSVLTVSQQAFTAGQTAVPGEPQYFMRLAQTVAGSGMTTNLFGHKIEDVRTLAGQSVNLSFWAKADAARTINLIMRQNFGSGGSANADSATQGANLTTTWQKFSWSLTLGSISGKTIGAGSFLYLIFNLAALNTVQTIDIAQVQLEAGSNAGPFQKKSFAEELLLCKRYYQKSFPYATVPAQNAGTTGAFSWVALQAGAVVTPAPGLRYPVSMRVSPTVTYYSPSAANAFAYNLQVGSCTTTTTGGSADEDVLPVAATTPAGTAVGNNLLVHFTAEADF